MNRNRTFHEPRPVAAWVVTVAFVAAGLLILVGMAAAGWADFHLEKVGP